MVLVSLILFGDTLHSLDNPDVNGVTALLALEFKVPCYLKTIHTVPDMYITAYIPKYHYNVGSSHSVYTNSVLIEELYLYIQYTQHVYHL